MWTIFPYAEDSETTQKTTQKLTVLQKAILEYLKNNPLATRKELVQNIENSKEDGIKYNLNRLKELGYIVREGADKGGSWKVLK